MFFSRIAKYVFNVCGQQAERYLVGPKPVSIPHQHALELRAAANQLDELVSFLVEGRHNSAAHDAHLQQTYAYGRSAHDTPLNARDQCVHRSSRHSLDAYTPGIMGLLKRGGDRGGYTELLGHPGVDAGVDRGEYVVVGAFLVEPVLQRSGL